MKRIISLIAVVLIAVMVFGQEKQQPNLPEQASENAKIKVEKIWERKFDEEIEDISATNNGETILVCLNNGDKVYLDKLGKILKRQKGKRGRALENGMFISYDGELLDSKGNTINKLVLGPPDIEYPIFSPSGKYFAIVPSYEADLDFIRMYETDGNFFLWEYKEKLKCEPMKSSFASDNTFVAFTNGKVIMFDNRTGSIIWERSLTTKTKFFGDFLVCTKYGHIAIYASFENTIYSLNQKGDIVWQYQNSKVNNIFLSPSGKFLVGIGENIIMFDNKTGDILWRKWYYYPRGTWKDTVVFTSNENYILVSGFINEKKANKTLGNKNCKIYLFDKLGRILDQIESHSEINTIPPQIKLTKNNAIIKDNKFVYCIQISEVK
jgi:outer membrane protein assembly factor BamB